jgi:hypothetical protein
MRCRWLAFLVVVAACTDVDTTQPRISRIAKPGFAVAGTLVTDTPVLGELIVCKRGVGSGDFTVGRTPDGTGFGVGATGLAALTLATSFCEVVVEDQAGENGGETVAVTEQNANFQSVTGFFIGINGVTPLANPQNGDSYFINSFHGIVLLFTNALVEEPPPGNQGCTPGYWKQDQHFGNWPVALGTTFADAGMSFGFTGTLLAGLQAGGGDVNALARHAAAAYLNSLASGVDFSLTTAEVQAIANGTGIYAGLTIEARKDLLAAANEGVGGCPLGRAEG